MVKEVRKIAVERDTTLTALVCQYLEKLVAKSTTSGRKAHDPEDERKQKTARGFFKKGGERGMRSCRPGASRSGGDASS
jgi:hypothetical protein